MSEKNIDEPIKTLAINDLNNLLADFFANVRNLESEVRPVVKTLKNSRKY
jgi:hypothetical protein